MGNSIGTLIVIWGGAIFAGLGICAIWRGFRSRLNDEDSTYGADEGDGLNFRK